MSGANLMLASILAAMVKGGSSVATAERPQADDRVAGYMITMIGSDVMSTAGLPLIRFLELLPQPKQLDAVQGYESLESIWERMEAVGIAWQILVKVVRPQNTQVFVFFLTGDKLCADVKKCVEESIVPRQPVMEGVR